jgi:hypothetical protein
MDSLLHFRDAVAPADLVAGDGKEVKGQLIYDLVDVIAHRGSSSEAGHYIIFSRVAANQWFPSSAVCLMILSCAGSAKTMRRCRLSTGTLWRRTQMAGCMPMRTNSAAVCAVALSTPHCPQQMLFDTHVVILTSLASTSRGPTRRCSQGQVAACLSPLPRGQSPWTCDGRPRALQVRRG